jgi:hypothetical protein
MRSSERHLSPFCTLFNSIHQMDCIWRSNIWPSSPIIQRFVWASNQIVSILRNADPVQTESSVHVDQSESEIAVDHKKSHIQTANCDSETVLTPSISASVGDIRSSSPTPTKQSTLPPFLEGKPFLNCIPEQLSDSDVENIKQKLRRAVFFAFDLPRQSALVLLKTLPVWSQALFDLLPFADSHQSKTLFEVLVSCIDSIKHASVTNHDFIQSVLSDWITWSVSTLNSKSDKHDPLYVVLLREFVRLLRPWLGSGQNSICRSVHNCHTAALSVADIILSLISKLAASTNHAQPQGIEQAWGHISSLASSLGSLIASGDLQVIFYQEDKEQPPRDLSSYLNVCSAFAEFLRGWFSLGQRGTTAQACFTFCHELCRHEKGEHFIVYFWKRFCSDAADVPFLFPPAYPDTPFPLFHWTGPASRRAQRVYIFGSHISKAGVENTPITSVAFNLCSGMLLNGSSNGTSLGLCIVNSIIGASCEFSHPSTIAVIRSPAASLLERLLLASAPFISKNHSSNSQAVTNFFSLVARTLTCVSEADWEQYWLQEIDKRNIYVSSSSTEHSSQQSSSHGVENLQKHLVSMSLFGWLKAMLIVAFKENQGLESESGNKSSADQIDPYPTSKYLNYSGKLDDDVKFSLAMSVSSALHVLLEHLKSEKFLQRLQISERKTHFFDVIFLDDSSKITGIATDQCFSKNCTLFEGMWSLLLHLHFILVCSQNSFEYKSHLFELSSELPSGEGRRGSITNRSKEVAANTKQKLESHYHKPHGETHLKLNSRETTKNVYTAIHCSLKLLLDQSVHCLFLSSSHDVLSCRYRNRVILQIFLEGTNMNQWDVSEFSSNSAQVSIASTLSLSSNTSADLIKRNKSSFSSVPSVSYEFFICDETQSLPNPTPSILSEASTSLDASVPFPSTEPSLEAVTDIQPNEMMFSRGTPKAAETSIRDDSSNPLPLRRAPDFRPASLRSLDTLIDQGNIKFLTDFVLMYIREDFRLNSSNMFASRFVFVLFLLFSAIKIVDFNCSEPTRHIASIFIYSLIFSFAFTSAVHDMYTVLTINPNFRISAAKTVSIILKVATSELANLNNDPSSRAESVFDGYDDSTMNELSSAASAMFSVIESIAIDAKDVWDNSANLDLADATYRIFLLTQRSAPSPYRRAFWLEKMAKMHMKKESNPENDQENNRPLEAAINLLELCVHANITAASSGGKLSMPLLGDGLVFPFIDYAALSHAFICPADGPVGSNAFLAAKDHKEFFSSESVAKCVENVLKRFYHQFGSLL